MKNYQNHHQAGRNRRQAAGRRLCRMEEKIDIIMADVNRIYARVLAIDRQQRGDFTEATINRLHAAAVRMGETADAELRAIKARYGTQGI